MDPPLERRIHHSAARGEVPRAAHHFTQRMNRLSNYFADEPEGEYGDFYVIAGLFFSAEVTRETAKRIERALGRWLPPRWIVFHDRVGSRYRVRSSMIRSLVESTAAQRAADRRHDRAREQEEKEDRRPWDD